MHTNEYIKVHGCQQMEPQYICISRQWQTALQDVRVYRGPDVASDHYLPAAMLKLKLKQRRSPKKRAQTFDVGNLKLNSMQEQCIQHAKYNIHNA